MFHKSGHSTKPPKILLISYRPYHEFQTYTEFDLTKQTELLQQLFQMYLMAILWCESLFKAISLSLSESLGCYYFAEKSVQNVSCRTKTSSHHSFYIQKLTSCDFLSLFIQFQTTSIADDLKVHPLSSTKFHYKKQTDWLHIALQQIHLKLD